MQDLSKVNDRLQWNCINRVFAKDATKYRLDRGGLERCSGSCPGWRLAGGILRPDNVPEEDERLDYEKGQGVLGPVEGEEDMLGVRLVVVVLV